MVRIPFTKREVHPWSRTKKVLWGTGLGIAVGVIAHNVGSTMPRHAIDTYRTNQANSRANYEAGMMAAIEPKVGYAKQQYWKVFDQKAFEKFEREKAAARAKAAEAATKHAQSFKVRGKSLSSAGRQTVTAIRPNLTPSGVWRSTKWGGGIGGGVGATAGLFGLGRTLRWGWRGGVFIIKLPFRILGALFRRKRRSKRTR